MTDKKTFCGNQHPGS